jgi:hypothetical protein
MLIKIGELTFAEPSFRQHSRIIARIDDRTGVAMFALQYQHDGEPGVWLPDPSFPWHKRNFDSLIRAAAKYHEAIEGVLKGEKSVEIHHHNQRERRGDGSGDPALSADGGSH